MKASWRARHRHRHANRHAEVAGEVRSQVRHCANNAARACSFRLAASGWQLPASVGGIHSLLGRCRCHRFLTVLKPPSCYSSSNIFLNRKNGRLQNDIISYLHELTETKIFTNRCIQKGLRKINHSINSDSGDF